MANAVGMATEPKKRKSYKVHSKARNELIAKTAANRGRPKIYTKKLGDYICNEIAKGKTLTKIADEMGIGMDSIYKWIANNEDFNSNYSLARESWAKTIVDRVIEESETITPEWAIAKKVRAQIVQWAAAKYAPSQFAESKRIELKGEVNHLHTHQLAGEQKRRIAEAWLISSGEGETVVIPDETRTRPALAHEPGDLEAAGVTTVADKADRIVPGRVKTEPTRKPKGKPGRKAKAKPNLDD